MRVEMDTTSPAIPQALTEPMWREVIAQLRAFVRRRIADPDRAEDLVGDIVLRIHQKLGSIDDQEKLAHWVSRVARNAVIDEYRRAARAREQLLDTPTETAAIAAVGPDADDASSVLDELSRCLRPLLAGLPAEQRRAVEMIDLDGMPQAGAAQPGGRVVVGDEVACAARAPPPGRAARPVLHVDAGCARRAHGLRARAGLLRGLRLQLSRAGGDRAVLADRSPRRRGQDQAQQVACSVSPVLHPDSQTEVDAPSGLAGLSSRTV